MAEPNSLPEGRYDVHEASDGRVTIFDSELIAETGAWISSDRFVELPEVDDK